MLLPKVQVSDKESMPVLLNTCSWHNTERTSDETTPCGDCVVGIKWMIWQLLQEQKSPINKLRKANAISPIRECPITIVAVIHLSSCLLYMIHFHCLLILLLWW